MEVRAEEAAQTDDLVKKLGSGNAGKLTGAEKVWLASVVAELRKDSRNAELADALEAGSVQNQNRE